MKDMSTLKTNPQRRQVARNAAGFTLVELMVALVLGLVLVAAILQFFTGTRLTFTANEAQARAQETGRFAMETMKPSIRSAGLGGICGGNPPVRNHLNLSAADAQALLSPTHAVRGWEFQNTGINRTVTLDNPQPGSGSANNWVAGGSIGNLPAGIVNLALPSSDVLLVREMRPVRGIRATDSNAPNQANININYDTTQGTDTVSACEILLVTNCNRADLFQVTNATSNSLTKGSAGGCSPGNQTPGDDWSATYRSATQFYRAESTAYFVGQFPNRDMPSLIRGRFIEGLAPQFEELVEGVENMQVLYGYSEPGPPGGSGDGQSVNFFLTANNVPNWEYVISVRIGLLARSPRNLGAGAAAQTFDVALTNVTHTPDQFLRQPYNTTIALRNRQIIR